MPRIPRTPLDYWSKLIPSPAEPILVGIDMANGDDRTVIRRLGVHDELLLNMDFTQLETHILDMVREGMARRIAVDMEACTREMLYGTSWLELDSLPDFLRNVPEKPPRGAAPAPTTGYVKRYNYFTERATHGAATPKPSGLLTSLIGTLRHGQSDHPGEAA